MLPPSPPGPDVLQLCTLATLGYGDITPVAKVSRALAEVEALAGMLYIAIFMARLVSMAGDVPSTNSTELAPTSSRFETGSMNRRRPNVSA
jgi:hypothetical protein